MPKLLGQRLVALFALVVCIFANNFVSTFAWTPRSENDAAAAGQVGGWAARNPQAAATTPVLSRWATSRLAPDLGLPTGFNLDLSSTLSLHTADIAVPTAIEIGGTLTSRGLVTGGIQQMINPGQLLTPAQYFALAQVLAFGGQSLILNNEGSATGGIVSLTPRSVESLSGLTVPNSVTVNSVGFAAATPFTVTGPTSIDGSLYALQRMPNATSVMNFGDLTIGQTGLISGAVPTNSYQSSKLYSSSALIINSTGSVQNQGTIFNTGNLVINSATGNITNSGTVSSSAGNVSFSSLVGQNLTFNNVGGSVNALNGSINFSSAVVPLNADIALVGGNFLSKTMNFYAGTGTVSADAETISGAVNTFADQARVGTADGNLKLGTIEITGDPTYYNKNGNIQITGDITVGETLTIVASGNITTTAGATSISTADGSGLGHDINIIAGANIVTNCGTCTSTIPGTASTQTITVNSCCFSSGNIDFSASPNLHINTNSTSGDKRGGNVNLIAGGTITLPAGSEVNASGSGNAIAGNVSVIANGSAISLGAIRANRISIYSALPTTEDGNTATNPIVFDSSGRSTSLISFHPAITTAGNFNLKNASISLNGNLNAGTLLYVGTTGAVTVAAGKTISGNATSTNSPAANIYMTGGSVSAGAVSANGNGTGSAGNVSLYATNGDLTVGNVSANGSSGGAISLFATNGTLTSGTLNTTGSFGGNVTALATNGINLGSIDTSANGTTGFGGNVVASTGNSSNSATLAVGSIKTSGASAGGLVMLVNSAANFSANNLTVSGSITTDATGLNGKAGPVSLVSTGKITTGNISARADANAGSTSALGGSVFISSGATGATAITVAGSTINTSASAHGAGNIAGNIILLSSAASTGANPGNINIAGATFKASGGTPKTAFIWGLNGASSTVPAALNVTATAAINIRPGGYQSATGSNASPQSISLNTGGDKQIVVPINIGAVDGSSNSLYLSTFTQASSNGMDNIALVTTGNIKVSGNLAPSEGTGYFVVMTPAKLDIATTRTYSAYANNINLAVLQGVNFSSPPVISMSAGNTLSIFGNLSNSNGTTSNDIALQSTHNLITQVINLSTCCSNPGGSLLIKAGGSVSAQNLNGRSGSDISITAGSYINTQNIFSFTNFNGGDSGGNVALKSGAYTSVGDIDAAGYCCGRNGGEINIASGTFIDAGNLHTFSANNSGKNIVLEANGGISALNLNANSSTCCVTFAGSVYVNSSGSYVSLGNIAAGKEYVGSVVINSGTYTNIGDVLMFGGSTNIYPKPTLSIKAGTFANVGNVSIASESNGFRYIGGDVYIMAGSSITYLSIVTGNSAGANKAGSVSMLAGTSIAGGQVNTADGMGGAISMLAGTSITTGALKTGMSGNCFDGCNGGNLLAVALGGNITVGGQIDTNSKDGPSGSVALVASGTITANGIKTASQNAIAGNVFVSSGASGAAAVSVGAIDTSSGSASANSAGNTFLGANVSGTNGISASGNTNISFTTASAFGTSATPSPYLFFNSNPTSITGNTTISVKYQASSSAVNVVPGFYTAIGTSATPVSVTLDLGGDSRTIVPIVSAGNIFLSEFKGDNNGAMPSQGDGYPVVLISNGTTGISLSGDVTSKHVIGVGVQGSESLYALGGGSILQSSGTIWGRNLAVYATGGSIGSSAKPIQANVIGLNSLVRDDLFITTGTNVTIGSVIAGDNIQLITGGEAEITNLMFSDTVSINSGGDIQGYGTIFAPNLSLVADDWIVINTFTKNLHFPLPSERIQVNNLSLDLNITGSVIADSSQIISITTAQDLTVTSASFQVPSGTVNLTAAGILEISGSEFLVNNPTYNGGAVNLNASSIVFTGENTSFNADGLYFSGSIKIRASDDPTNHWTIGAGDGQIKISAEAPLGGGIVLVENKGSVTIVGKSGVFEVQNDTVEFLTASIDYSQGAIDVGNGILEFVPNGPIVYVTDGFPYSDIPITIGGSAKGPGLTITANELANTTAGTLFIGTTYAEWFGALIVREGGPGNVFWSCSNCPFPLTALEENSVNVGDITLIGNLDFSNMETVAFATGGSYVGTNSNVTLGNSDYYIEASGNIKTGTITGGTSYIGLYTNSGNSASTQYGGLVTPQQVAVPTLTIEGPVTLSGEGVLTAWTGPNGKFVQNANMGGSSATVNLSISAFNLPAAQNEGTIIADTFNLLSLSVGELGSASTPLNINVKNLNVISYQSVYLSNTSSNINIVGGLTNSNVIAGIFYLDSLGSINTTGSIFAQAIQLQTLGNNNADINIGSNIVGTWPFGPSVAIFAGGAGSISHTAGTISGPEVWLISGRGDIGALSSPIQTATSRIMVASTQLDSGSAYIANQGAVTIIPSSVGGTFVFSNSQLPGETEPATVTLFSVIALHGSLEISTSSGGISVVPRSTLIAGNGDLALWTTDSVNGFISIGANSTLKAGSFKPGFGNIYILAGLQPYQSGAAPTGITINEANGGQVQFSVSDVSAAGSNTINADGRNVVIASADGKPITINGGLGAGAYSHPVDILDVKIQGHKSIFSPYQPGQAGFIPGTVPGSVSFYGCNGGAEANNAQDAANRSGQTITQWQWSPGLGEYRAGNQWDPEPPSQQPYDPGWGDQSGQGETNPWPDTGSGF